MTDRGRIAEHVAWLFDEGYDTVYLAPLPEGPPMVLRESSALIWCALADGVDDVADAIARDAEEAEQIRPDVVDFIGKLRAQGWVT